MIAEDEKKDAEWPEWSICSLENIGSSGAKAFLVGGGDWPCRGFVVRSGEKVFAYANVCPHRRFPLDSLPDQFLVDDGQLIRCAAHGALFEVDTGECVSGPCFGAKLLPFPVRVSDQGEVYVRAPDNLRDILERQIGGSGFVSTS